MHQPRHLFRVRVYSFSVLLWVVGGMYLAPLTLAQQAPSAEKEPATTGLKDTDEFYRPNQVQVIHLQVHESDLHRMMSALPQRIYVPAVFRWGNQTIENVGVRYKGNSSSIPHQPHKRSFLIKFDEFEKDQTFLGLERIALDNGVQFGSLFSEPLITGVLRDLGIQAPRCNFAKLYLNGKYHGVYVNVERIDTVFVKNHFADADGASTRSTRADPAPTWVRFHNSLARPLAGAWRLNRNHGPPAPTHAMCST